jgi:hypothetical protein
VETGSFSISITHGESGPLLSSARGLAIVKLDAIDHAQRAVREGLQSAVELERHEVELAEARDLVDQLERSASSRRGRGRLTGRRALVDEIVLGALIAEGQELADSIVELDPGAGLAEITTRLEVVRRLVTTLARVRR